MSRSSSEYDSERESNPSVFDDEDISFYHQTEIGMIINEKYKVIEKLGSGRFSRVWKVLNTEDNKHYALKIYKSSKDYDDYYKNEVQVYTILGDDVPSTIVKKYDNFEIEDEHGSHGCLLFELCGSNLIKLLEQSDDNKLPEPIVKYIVKQVLEALKFIHSKNLIHTDIKPENILLEKDFSQISDFYDMKVKLLDLGSSTVVDDLYTLSIGTTPYLAPEVVLRSKYNTSVDIWAVGCLIYELMTGDCLFDPEAYFDSDDENSDDDSDGDSDDDSDDESRVQELDEDGNVRKSNESEGSTDFSEDNNCEDWELIHLHLSLFHKTLGPLPPSLVEKGEYFEDFFTKDGKLRRIPNYIEKKNIQNILIDDYEFSEVNAKKLAYVLEKLFIYLPDERLTPTQVLDLDWFSGDLKTEYEKLLGIYQREQKKRKKKQKKEQAREQAKQQANNK